MKRMRPVNSCLQCRRRRVRCDKERPRCGRCVTGRVECQYDEGPSTEALSAVAGAGQSSSTQSTEGRNSRANNAGDSIITDVPNRRRSVEKGHLTVSHGGRSSYKGATFWATAIPSEFLEDDGYIGDSPSHGLLPQLGNFMLPDISSRQCRYCGSAYRISCIQYLLPNRTTCEKLCEIFFATVFPLMPIFHVPDFVRDFEAFWRETEGHQPHESEPASIVRAKPSFLSLLSAMLFAALSSAPPARVESILGEAATVTAADMCFASMTCTTLTGFPRSPTLYSLAAYMIVQGQFIREEEFSDSPDFIGTSFRIALGMGLHRHLPKAGFSTAELETRRRLWWYILHLDVMSSASSGISPFFIDDKMANTDMIHPYDETEDESGRKIQLNDVRYLVAVKRYEVTREMRIIIRDHFEDAFDSPSKLTETLQKLEEIRNKVNEATQSLLDFSVSPDLPREGVDPKAGDFGRVWKLEQGTSDKEVKQFAAWSSLLLHMMIHKAYCILYHPLFRNSASITEIPVRENTIKHAQAFLQLFIRVCDDPISEPFHWMYPGTYQPFQALALLLADMLQYPHSEEASLSRGIVDAVFYLYRVDEGVVSQIDPPKRQLSSTGRSAWSMLVRTRKKVLDMIGDDHHVLLPSHMISSDNCVCGERISGRRVHPREESAQSQPRHTSSTPRPFYEDPSVIQQTWFSNEFNWQEFEASIAPEAGFIP